ncbi:MAG: glycerol-3-phosphate dehydrogenase/oxidase [Chloroflexi bacterium]|nr:glycerol-3-phosphate dehydrogenase/oxidase [Chloroflexota bacterium]
MTASPQRADRGSIIDRLRGETFDLAIIGGGITGAWIARDAVLRGLSVALVEKGDFASGTSSRSARFVHGGLRYLRHRHVGLVREGLRERGLLLRLAPHLVRPFPFVLPVYEGDRTPRFLLRIGLTGYDLLAGTMGLGRHRSLSKQQLMKEVPALASTDLRGGFSFFDAITNDSRLTLSVMLSAIERGAAAANYVEAVSWEKTGGRVTAVNCRDSLAGDEFTVRARVVIGAAGPWTDDLRALGGGSAVLRPTKGIHIVVPRDRLHTDSIVTFFWEDRPLYAVPAGNYTYVGATDTDWSGDPDGATAAADDVSYTIDAVNANFETKLTAADVTATWAGVRPLIAEEGAPSPSDVARDYEIFDGPAGVYTICGGKLTSARSMAEDMLDRVIEKEVEAFATKPGRCRTRRAPLPGAVADFARYREQAASDLVQGWDLTATSAKHLVDTFGARHTRVLGHAARDAGLLAHVVGGSDELLAQVAYAASDEMAVTLEDVMRRRSDLMLFGPPGDVSAAASVATVLASSLGWDDTEKKRQIAAHDDAVSRMMSFARPVRETALRDS